MTRYEQLQRLADDERTEARHVALFHAITESWVTEGTKQRWEIDHKSLMQLARLKGSTYRKTLRELANWTHIDYAPTSNRHAKTAINFRVTVPYSDKVRRVATPESGAVRYCNRVTTSVFTTVNGFTTPVSDTVNGFTTPECNAVKPFTAPDSTTVSLFYRARIWQGDIVCSHPDTVLGQGLGENDNALLHNTITLSTSKIISKKVDSKVVVVKEKRVQGKKPKNAERQVLPVGCKFTESPVFEAEIFTNAFRDDDRYKGVDLGYYRERMLNWRDKTGGEPTRADWIVVARTFMLNDLKESKLKMIDTKTRSTNASRNNQRSSGQPIIPATSEKRPFGDW